ncbi:MAG: hypothetical protein HY806_00140, partial [Nitrospirae bacterium]|nr:hypothetical protein [Nitrospirota bacterium]
MGRASKKKRNLTGAVSSAKSKQIEPLSQTIDAETGLLHKPKFHILLIITIGLIAYSNTFNAPFHFDDIPNIVE